MRRMEGFRPLFVMAIRRQAMLVRRAVVDDARAIAEVHVRGWRQGYRGLVPAEILDRMSVDERESIGRGMLADMDDSAFTLVAIGEGQRVKGFCSVAAPSRDEDAGAGTAEVAATYVDPECWRRGVGGALLRAAVAELLERGWGEVTLWVFTANDPAQAFYESLGFEPDGATKTGHPSGQELVRMRAPLTKLRPGGPPGTAAGPVRTA